MWFRKEHREKQGLNSEPTPYPRVFIWRHGQNVRLLFAGDPGFLPRDIQKAEDLGRFVAKWAEIVHPGVKDVSDAVRVYPHYVALTFWRGEVSSVIEEVLRDVYNYFDWSDAPLITELKGYGAYIVHNHMFKDRWAVGRVM